MRGFKYFTKKETSDTDKKRKSKTSADVIKKTEITRGAKVSAKTEKSQTTTPLQHMQPSLSSILY